MSARGAARQYANALFDVASKAGSLDRVRRDLLGFAALVAGNAELKHVLSTPALPVKQKHAIVDALIAASGDFADETRRVLELMADRDRLWLIEDVVSTFAERSMDADEVITAEVTSAVPLDDAPKAALVAALGKAVGRRVTITERVDPSIIGGVVAKVGSLVFDGSVTRQIERMREKLLADA